MENVDVFSAIDNKDSQNYSFSMHFIGPHVSIRENISLSPERAHELGATGFAIFTKNQRIWSAPPLKDEDAVSFRNEMARLGFSPSSVLPHAGYLINPASPDEELRKRRMKSRLILQVHDELLIEADENEVEEVKEILKDKMEHAADLSVPLIADMHTGKNWYEAK